MQRLEPVAPESWVRGAWHEAVIGSPRSTAAASTTGIKEAAVIQRDRPQVPHQIEVERQLLERLNLHSRPEADLMTYECVEKSLTPS